MNGVCARAFATAGAEDLLGQKQGLQKGDLRMGDCQGGGGWRGLRSSPSKRLHCCCFCNELKTGLAKGEGWGNWCVSEGVVCGARGGGGARGKGRRRGSRGRGEGGEKEGKGRGGEPGGRGGKEEGTGMGGEAGGGGAEGRYGWAWKVSKPCEAGLFLCSEVVDRYKKARRDVANA